MFGDTLENLTTEELRLSPSIARLSGTHLLTSASDNVHQQILDATRDFYATRATLVDTAVTNIYGVAQNAGFVLAMNGFRDIFRQSTLPAGARSMTRTALFGAGLDREDRGDGLFTASLEQLQDDAGFATVAVGVNLDVMIGAGGLGGLGCCWDIEAREAPRGYGYLTGEHGCPIASCSNLQFAAFTAPPSRLRHEIVGLALEAPGPLGIGLMSFFAMQGNGADFLGFALLSGADLSGPPTLFSGHLWNFS